MAQHDYNIANQSGADFRADLNNALSAIVTVNSGATEPTTTFAHQLWVDTANSVLKIRNAADNAWYTTGISITASNTFTGDLTGNVVGNVTGNLVGDVTGDLTGNADTATTLATARTISLSGDVVGSASFDGSGDITISTTAQINSIALGTDTTGDYVESISGGTGVTVTGGTGEGSTPSIAIGQAVATTSDVTFNTITATDQFIGDIRGAVRFNASADGALSKGDVVYISGVSGNTPTVAKAKADDASKMPAFGFAADDANDNAAVEVVTFGTLTGLDTSGVSVGQVLYVSTTAGAYTTTAPSGESAQIQNIGKVQKSHATTGSIKVGGAGRSNATPNLDDGKIFIGNASNQSSTATLDTSIVVENTNLYYTTTRANTDFDTRLATKDTGDLTEGTNLYYTSARANTDFDTRLATKSTTNLIEGTNLYYTSARFDSAFTAKDTDDLSEGLTNLYYTTARFDSAFGNKDTDDLTEGSTNLYYTTTRANSAIDTRVTKAFVDALGIQASSVDANSVALGTDTTGNYVQTITGTANKITVTGSGSESADITLTLPDDVQIADSLTVAGNLTVNGTLTSLDTTNLDIEDNLFQLNAGLTGSPVNDSGMLINRGSSDNGIFMWDESVDKFTLGLTTADGSATGNITLNSLGTLVANIEGAVTGNVTGTVSSLANHDTGDLAEGTNLYYTTARFDSAFTGKSTSDLSEGTNLYYTDARFDTRLATKDTDDVSEGTTNLYYTTARFDSAFSGKSTTDLSEGTNLYYTSARANSDFDTRLATKSTSDLSEGTNLYYTDARARASISEDSTQLSYNSTTGVLSYTQGDTDTVSEGTTNLYYTDTRANSAIDARVTKTFVDALNVVAASATGNAGTATALATARDFSIAGDITASAVSFDGTGNVALSASIDANTVGISEINVTDGTSGQVLTTDGAGNLSFSTVSGTTINNNADNRVITGSGTANTLNGETNFVFDGTNVGIGTSSPATALEVKGDGSSIQVSSDDYDVALLGRRGSSGTNLDKGYLRLRSEGVTKVVIDSDFNSYFNGGNVGIGNSSPSAKIHATIEGSVPTIASETVAVFNRSGGLSHEANISIIGGATGASNIHFGDTADEDIGKIEYRHDSNYMAFNTNATERMRINSSGTMILQADGAANLGRIQFSSQASTYQILGGNNIGYMGYKTGGYHRFFGSDGAEDMRIDSSGNVGIGTSNPLNTAHIYGTGQTTANLADSGNQGGMLRITDANTAAGAGGAILFANYHADDEPSMGFAAIKGLLNNGSTYTQGSLAFSTRNAINSSALTERMRIWYNGNIGIKTTSLPNATLQVNGSLSKSSGSFTIDHPLESKKDTHNLVHSFVEAPQADNIYRGVVSLVDGSATINLDTEAGMTEGTFILLNTNTSCFTSNESDWDAVKGSVSGNILTISCQNTTSTATISWLVIGERHDQHMLDTEWTDENGKVIVEPLKIVEPLEEETVIEE